ncbi:MAG: polyprenyl synthetase family protein [Anaerolineae bacterium]
MTGKSLSALLAPFRPDIERIESLLRDTLDQVEEPLGPSLRRFFAGGKRLRPALVVLVGRLFGPLPPSSYKLAAAIEMLHAATLIHDDILDAASVRRGQKTLHVTWSTNAAVLAGDCLLAQAMALTAEIAATGAPEVMVHLADVLCAVCAGEIRQTLAPREDYSRDAYYRRIEGKTASLCAVTAQTSGILAGADAAQTASLRRFGHELGIAYQIVDDVLDLAGQEEQLGKPPGNDLCCGLVTLPVLYYLEGTADGTPVDTVLQGQRDGPHVRAAVEAIRASGAVEASLCEAQDHASQAQNALNLFPDTLARQTLHALAEYIVSRGH